MIEINKIYLGDCLEVMKDIPDGSVDMVLCDPPYGTTACKWDSVIPFNEMWKQLSRVIKPNGVIVLFGSEPFSSLLRVSNLKNYKYDWVWKKSHGSFATAKTQPLKRHELISVFSTEKHTYNRQMEKIKGEARDRRKENYRKVNTKNNKESATNPEMSLNYADDYNPNYKNPISVIEYSNPSDKRFHPTQKPVALMEYLIKTYTSENEIVLDFTIGSGTTAIAAIQTGRNFIGIEKEQKYCDIARQRISQAQPELFNNLDKTGS